MQPNVILEDLIEEIGGCGRYQIISAVTIHGCKTVLTWSMMMMAVAGAVPGWGCIDIDLSNNFTTWDNDTSLFFESCTGRNSTKCTNFFFEPSMNTIVNEWNLVCSRRWIPATVITIQMAGVLVACIFSGQLADTFGRRPIYYLSHLLLVIGNIIAYFSVSWEMFAVLRFVIGVATGGALTTMYPLICEMMIAKWRTITIVVPSWSIEMAMFAFVAWLIPDWKYLHLIVGILGIPCLATSFYMKESFRWLYASQRKTKAEIVVEEIAKMNKRPVPDLAPYASLTDKDREESTARVSVIDLFRTRQLALITLRTVFVWTSCGYVFYAISFGVQALSGNIFLNFFLLGAVDIPSLAISIFLVNKFGRRATALTLMLLSGLAAIVVACAQYMDPSIRGGITNGFALLARLSGGPGWQAFIVLTLEIYPTVVRNLGYGVSSTGARVGGIIAPQIIYLDTYVPGLMYFICGALMLICCVLTWTLPETKDLALADTVKESHTKEEENRIV